MININSMIDDTRISTLLFYACFQGDLKLVKEMFEQYPRICEISIKDAFIHSITNGNIEVVKFLLSTTSVLPNLNNSLLDAAREGQLEIFKLLEKVGIDIHFNDDEAFIESAKAGKVNIVQYLVENNTNIHHRNELALRKAAQYNRVDVVKFLVEKGANIQSKNNEAVMHSARHSFMEQLEYLLSKGGSQEIAEKHARNEAKIWLLAKSLEQNLNVKSEKPTVKAKI